MKFPGNVLQRIDPPRGRLICIGDIHGCYDELIELLDRVAPKAADVVVSTGDIVRKGPQVARCLELWRDRGYLAVIGNNEEKLLRFAESSRARRLLLPPQDRKLLRRAELMEFVRGWPVAIDVPARNVTIVHGGLYPGMRVDGHDLGRAAMDVTRMRWIRRLDGQWQRAGRSKQRDADVLWAEVWDGPRTVVYGHTPLREPRVDARAIGLDTGCVYGGWLTAAIHDGTWRFERVRAREKYAD
ncbi:MAG TPA: metallophosphoesterase [Thermoanaerobaculia bacterium]|nr:metallophosphoesterase [Thermoanaerobaculia bacterium]